MPIATFQRRSNVVNLFCLSKSHKTQKYSLYCDCVTCLDNQHYRTHHTVFTLVICIEIH